MRNERCGTVPRELFILHENTRTHPSKSVLERWLIPASWVSFYFPMCPSKLGRPYTRGRIIGMLFHKLLVATMANGSPISRLGPLDYMKATIEFGPERFFMASPEVVELTRF